VRPPTRYRSSAFRGFVAAAVILSLVTVLVVATAVQATIVRPVIIERTAVATDAALQTLGQLGWLFVALILLALVTFAAWLSRVVDNVPALTGVYPRATPRWAFVQVLVPVLNFAWIPSILREVLTLLDPRGNGNALIAAAIIPIFVAAVGWGFIFRFVRPVARATGLGVTQAIELQVLFTQIAVGLAAIGAVMLVAVISRIERKARARHADLERAGDA
jgi:hypothetical protein